MYLADTVHVKKFHEMMPVVLESRMAGRHWCWDQHHMKRCCPLPHIRPQILGSLKKRFFDHMRIVTRMQSKQCCIQHQRNMCHQSKNMSAYKCTERPCCCQSYPSLIGTNQSHYAKHYVILIMTWTATATHEIFISLWAIRLAVGCRAFRRMHLLVLMAAILLSAGWAVRKK